MVYNLFILGNHYLFSIEASYPFRKGYPIQNNINKIIRRITETGYQIHWTKMVQHRDFEISKASIFVLTIEHLQGPFYLLLGGYFIAILIGLYEVFF